MKVLHERVEALEKIGAGGVADQALLKLVRLHMQKYEKYRHCSIITGLFSSSVYVMQGLSALTTALGSGLGK